MKTKVLFFLAFALCVCFTAQGQKKITMGDLTKQQQDSILFAFPHCTKGTVYFKNGSVYNGRLNYNHYEPQVLFRNDKPESPEDTLRRLDNLADVLMIQIGDRQFVPVLSGLGEIVLNNKVSLILSRKVNIEEKKTGAYGTGGSTSSIRAVSGFSSNNGTSSGSYSGQTTFTNVNYDFAANSELSIDDRLFLLKDGKVTPLTKKSLLKHFPAAANYINRYIEEQKPDLDNVDQMRNFVNLIYANF
ncbi:MAG: hypothetical protein NC048_05140 [Bacteroides sp.]|nr:hypothetical protein [Ruminococcus flavefaciens]MCM1554861.1 hypothetical protein [Bacteroides sp.]